MSEAEPVPTVINGHTFTIDTRYVLTDSRILGKGSFGVVCTAYDSIRKIDMAIKRIRPFANDDWDARHTLREIRLMKLLGPHPNVISLFELSLFEPKTELYMMMEVMDCDLHRVIQSKQSLTEKHHKCFVRQILEGIKAMHAIGVFHRDLKPGNILVSKDCQLRITDFGLARFMDDNTRLGNNQLNPMTEYVVTRWYRCPELLLSPNRPYSEAIDLWSIGCILAELLRRKPLFPGKSHPNQVQLIFEVLGFSNEEELGFPLTAEASAFLEKRCRFRKQPLQKFMPNASKEALDLLESLLSVNPNTRPSAEEALHAQFLDDAEILSDYSSVRLSRPSADFFDFEQEKYSLDQLREMIVDEVHKSSASAYRSNGSKQDKSGSRGGGDDPGNYDSPSSNRDSPADSKPGSNRDRNNSSKDTGSSSFHSESQQKYSQNSTKSASGKSLNYRTVSSEAINYQAAAAAAGRTNDENDGPASQLATQQRMHSRSDKSKDNPFRSGSAKNDSSKVRSTSVVGPGQLERSNSTIKDEEGDMLYSANIPQGNILVAARRDAPASVKAKKSCPKTPSPKKKDSIIQKDLNNKRRFMMQGMATGGVAAREGSEVEKKSGRVMPTAARNVPFPSLTAKISGIGARITGSRSRPSSGGSHASHEPEINENSVITRSSTMMHSGSNVVYNRGRSNY